MSEPTPAEIRCLYCGKYYPANTPSCPHCQAPTHTRTQASRLTRFRWFVLALIVFCAVMIVWLPR